MSHEACSRKVHNKVELEVFACWALTLMKLRYIKIPHVSFNLYMKDSLFLQYGQSVGLPAMVADG